MARFTVSSLILVAALCYALAEDNSLDDVSDTIIDRTSLSSLNLPSDLSVPGNILHLLASAGALVLGVIGVTLVLSMVLPLFGVRLCNLLGTCDHLGSSFVASQPLSGVGQAYDAYGSAATYNNPNAGYTSGSYQRRSLEYVGPILKALSSAYDKYAAAAKGAAARTAAAAATKAQ